MVSAFVRTKVTKSMLGCPAAVGNLASKGNAPQRSEENLALLLSAGEQEHKGEVPYYLGYIAVTLPQCTDC